MNARCAKSRPKTQKRTLGYDFTSTSDSPQCPLCGFGTDHPRLPVTRLTVIHYDQLEDAENQIGVGYRACDPDMSISAQTKRGGTPDPWHQGTGHIGVVNCPACKETQAYKDAVKAAAEE
jgi:hypothetical protein